MDGRKLDFGKVDDRLAQIYAFAGDKQARYYHWAQSDEFDLVDDSGYARINGTDFSAKPYKIAAQRGVYRAGASAQELKETTVRLGLAIRARIAEEIGGDGFAAYYDRLPKLLKKAANRCAILDAETGAIPGAMMDEDLIEELGAGDRWIMLSGKSLIKNKTNHGNLKAGDYLMLQQIVDGNLVFHDPTEKRKRTHLLGFKRDDEGKWWIAGWKKTEDGKESYMTTLYYMTDEKKARRKINKLGKPITRRK